ncbi:MAG: DEAD/DEAH box helicase, partial [Patescibacteria group bacterium]|nr:DEAD/DEAH box helicase [Patescibacteria group bacterium]
RTLGRDARRGPGAGRGSRSFGGDLGGRSFGSRGGSRGPSMGAGRSRKRGGPGAFGQTEAEIAKFINRGTPIEAPEAAFEPEHAFADFDIDARLKANLESRGYKAPTPIQDKAIEPGLEGRDIVGLAETGTGKTAAFLLPLIEKVLRRPGERILVMAPTRELAVQIEKELAGFAKGLGFRGMVAVGGANINPQIQALRHKPSFVIGTPGRLKDLMERGALNLSTFGSVVLDEADRMLDMGFIDDMRFILSHLGTPRHTLFFSATMGKDIEKLIGEFLTNPVMISVKRQETSANVEQDVVRVAPESDKFEELVRLLGEPGFDKVLVFCRTKYGAERLAKMLSRRRIFAESIHGDKAFNARLRALEEFKRGKVQALVATDVAARGLDIPAVSHVINYDLPSTYEDYVHRIGRTGRAAARGKALTFVAS